MKTEICRGWGLRVGGELPYLSKQIHWNRGDVECTETYHRPVRVVLISLAEYRKLKKLEKEIKP